MFSHQELFLFCSDLPESLPSLRSEEPIFFSFFLFFFFFFLNMVHGQWSSKLNFAPLEHTVKPFHSDCSNCLCWSEVCLDVSYRETEFSNTQK
ncbi:hypothetical protein ACRRTK_021700 [Alexandromys fortis]